MSGGNDLDKAQTTYGAEAAFTTTMPEDTTYTTVPVLDETDESIYDAKPAEESGGMMKWIIIGAVAVVIIVVVAIVMSKKGGDEDEEMNMEMEACA